MQDLPQWNSQNHENKKALSYSKGMFYTFRSEKSGHMKKPKSYSQCQSQTSKLLILGLAPPWYNNIQILS